MHTFYTLYDVDSGYMHERLNLVESGILMKCACACACACVCVCVCVDSKGLSNPGEVEALREKVYASLEAYCKHKYPEQPGR